MNWQSFPKTELHLHLEGAAPPAFIRALGQEKGIDLSHVISGDHYIWRDFNEFLATYEAMMAVLTTPDDFARLTTAVLSAQAEHGVLYTEIFLGSILMSDNDAGRWVEMLEAIEEASAKAEDRYGIQARFIAVIVRHFGAERAEETARLASQHSSPRLTGFGMAGAEDYGHARDFAKAFDIARDAGLGLTAHSGEWGAPDTIRETIEALGVRRLGHGVRAVEDASLIAFLKSRDIHLEVCPGSNVALGVAPDWAAHQIHKLKAENVSLSISTDDPPFFQTTMTREYEELAALGWTKADFIHSNCEAMRHAFVDEAVRQSLISRFKEAQ